MKKTSVVLITNPHAGRGGSERARQVERFCARLADHGVAVDVHQTLAPGDATRLAAKLSRQAKTSLIIASGGDGTINETLQGLIGTPVKLAVWPAGTANVLAREIKMPFAAERAADVIARGHSRRIHLGRATEETGGASRYFFLMAGVGLDASVVQGVRPALKRRVGEAAFWYSGLEHLALWQPETFHVEIDGVRHPATFAAVGKAPRYGGNLPITPRARLENPEFEVCLVNTHSRLRYLLLLAELLRGGSAATGEEVSAKRNADVTFWRTTRLRAVGGAPVQADGELIGRLPMTFEIAPETVELVGPEKTL